MINLHLLRLKCKYFARFSTVLLNYPGVFTFGLAFLNDVCTFLSTCSEKTRNVSTVSLLITAGFCGQFVKRVSLRCGLSVLLLSTRF